MISLTDGLETTIDINGKEVPIDLSYDNVLRYFELIDDQSFDNAEKVMLAYDLFVGENEQTDPDLIVGVVKAISDYISEQPYGYDYVPGDNQPPVENIKYYSYEQDAGAIYASFLSQYGIDLVNERGKLHWDRFKALLDGLGEDTPFKQIVSIRQRSMEGLDTKEMAQLTELQAYYRIKDGQSADEQIQRTDAVLDALFND